MSAARGVVRVPSVNNYYVLLYYVNKSHVTVFRVLVMIGSTNIAVLVSVKLTTVYFYIGCFFHVHCFFPCMHVIFPSGFACPLFLKKYFTGFPHPYIWHWFIHCTDYFHQGWFYPLYWFFPKPMTGFNHCTGFFQSQWLVLSIVLVFSIAFLVPSSAYWFLSIAMSQELDLTRLLPVLLP